MEYEDWNKPVKIKISKVDAIKHDELKNIAKSKHKTLFNLMDEIFDAYLEEQASENIPF